MENVEKRSSVPLGHKIAYGAGMLGNQMFPAALGVFMVVLVKGEPGTLILGPERP